MAAINANLEPPGRLPPQNPDAQVAISLPPAIAGAYDCFHPGDGNRIGGIVREVAIESGDDACRSEVEIATTPEQRRRGGLRRRREVTPDTGMLFVFDAPAVQAMRMKDSPLSLGLLFFDDGGAPPCVSARILDPEALPKPRPVPAPDQRLRRRRPAGRSRVRRISRVRFRPAPETNAAGSVAVRRADGAETADDGLDGVP